MVALIILSEDLQEITLFKHGSPKEVLETLRTWVTIKVGEEKKNDIGKMQFSQIAVLIDKYDWGNRIHVLKASSKEVRIII
jgi:hypothetical protein